jgi:hypothetical protein
MTKNLETASSSETLVVIYKSTLRRIPEDENLHPHCAGILNLEYEAPHYTITKSSSTSLS